jgi:hydroxyacylglutathione hydrolase
MRELIQIPLLRDNYTYLAIHEGRAFVVDAAEAGPVLEWLSARSDVKLEAVINTHHHPDHTGGNAELIEATGCEVYGARHDAERIPGITQRVDIGQSLEVAGFSLRVLDVRAHTKGHVAFACDDAFERVVRHGHEGAPTEVERLANKSAVFVGDTMFMAGCGRLFEGTAAQLKDAFERILAEGDDRLVVCAHEYTKSNLNFAHHLLPDDEHIKARLYGLDDERMGSGSSVPDVLGRERETNPFVLALTDTARVAEATGSDPNDPVATLGAARAAKDTF